MGYGRTVSKDSDEEDEESGSSSTTLTVDDDDDASTKTYVKATQKYKEDYEEAHALPTYSEEELEGLGLTEEALGDDWDSYKDLVATGDFRRINEAYREVLGRNADRGGYWNYLYFKPIDPDALRLDLATSFEAQDRGIDASEYGAVAVEDLDYASLSPAQQQYIDAYRGESTKYKLFQNQLEGWIGAQGTGSDEGIQRGIDDMMAFLTGEATYESYGRVYSQDAIDRMGGTYTPVGYNAAQTIILPEGVDITGGLWNDTREWEYDDGTGSGVFYSSAKGEMTQGLFGEPGQWVLDRLGQDIVGVVDVIMTLANPFHDLSKDIMFGSEGGSDIDQEGGDLVESVGIRREDWETFEEVQEVVAKIVVETALNVIAPGSGMLFEAAYQGLKSYQANLYGRGGDFDWGTAIVDVGMAGIPSFGVGAWAKAGEAAVKAAATEALKQEASTRGYNEGEGDKIWQAAAVSLAGSATQGNVYGFDTSAIGRTAAQYAFADEDERDGVLKNALMAAVVDTASNRSKGNTKTEYSGIGSEGYGSWLGLKSAGSAKSWEFGTPAVMKESIDVQDPVTGEVQQGVVANKGYLGVFGRSNDLYGKQVIVKDGIPYKVSTLQDRGVLTSRGGKLARLVGSGLTGLSSLSSRDTTEQFDKRFNTWLDSDESAAYRDWASASGNQF